MEFAIDLFKIRNEFNFMHISTFRIRFSRNSDRLRVYNRKFAHTLDNALPALLPLAIIWSLLISLVILQFSDDTILLDELLSPKPAELVDLIPLSLDIS